MVCGMKLTTELGTVQCYQREGTLQILMSQGGEGVVLVLSSKAKEAWKEGGTKWRAWSSRLIVATLAMRRHKNDCLHVLYPAMHLPLEPVGRKRNSSMLIYSRHSLPFHLERATLYLGISMLGLGRGKPMVCGGTCVCESPTRAWVS